MAFEWDSQKRDDNLSKHGVDFEEAKSIFEDPLYVDFYEPDHSVGEERLIIVGESEKSRLLVVSYTERQNAIRLISARQATPTERSAYEEE